MELKEKSILVKINKNVLYNIKIFMNVIKLIKIVF